MCGIFTITDIKGDASKLRKRALTHVKRIRHRGPDWSGVYSDEHAVICHERLAIVDINHGAQPLVDSGTGRVLAVNGEIYNHKQLRADYLSETLPMDRFWAERQARATGQRPYRKAG